MLPFDPQRPFNSLPLLPPPTQALEHPRVLKTCIEAARNLERLNSVAGDIPRLATWLMPLLEARWSAAIEGIETSVEEVLLAAAQAPCSSNAEQVCRIAKIIQKIPQTPYFTTSPRRHAIMLNRQVLNANLGIRQTSGVCLKSINHVVYTPPRGEQVVANLIGNWEKFLQPVVSIYGLDSLIKLAVQHYQFEAIHPFIDGNGRTGRVLNILYAFDRGLIYLPVMNLSRWFWIRRVQYYKSLMMVTEKAAWVDWIAYVLEGIDDCSLWGHRLLSSLVSDVAEIKKSVDVLDCCPEHAKPRLSEFLSGRVYFSYSDFLIMFEQVDDRQRLAIIHKLLEMEVVGQTTENNQALFYLKYFLESIYEST